jgi:hypothetical protein
MVSAQAPCGYLGAAMILFVVFQRAPLFMIALLGIMVYLAVIEVRNEPGMSLQGKVWWVLLVFLTNFPGLIALRLYLMMRRRRPTS